RISPPFPVRLPPSRRPAACADVGDGSDGDVGGGGGDAVDDGDGEGDFDDEAAWFSTGRAADAAADAVVRVDRVMNGRLRGREWVPGSAPVCPKEVHEARAPFRPGFASAAAVGPVS